MKMIYVTWTILPGLVTLIAAYAFFSRGKTEKKVLKRVFQICLIVGTLLICVGFGLLLSDIRKSPLQTPVDPITGGVNSTSSFSFADEAAIKRTLKDAVIFECLTIYRLPEDFQTKYRNELSRYWLPIEQGGKAVEAIEASVLRLIRKGWRYGAASANEAFERRSIRIIGESAKVSTRERWYLPITDKDGKAVEKRNAIQTWHVDYVLKKVNGQWLIADSTAPYPAE
jgi:hypothetical protein